MNANEATALATRLAEKICSRRNPDSSIRAYGIYGVINELLQAQAVEDDKALDMWKGTARQFEKMVEDNRHNYVGASNDLTKSQKENTALRALVGRMKTAMGNLRDARGRHNSGIAYERLLEALQEADKITAPASPEAAGDSG